MSSSLRYSKARRVLSYARPYWRQLALILTGMLLSVVLSLPQPIVLKLLIDDVLLAKNLPKLHLLLAGLLGLYILQNIVGLGQKYLTSVVGQRLLIDIRREIYDHLQRLSPKFYSNAQMGDLLSRTMYDASALQAIASTTLINLLTNVVTLVIISGIIFYMNWRLALISFVTVPCFAVVILIYNEPIRRASMIVRQEIAHVNSHLQENVSGIRLIQAFARETYESQRFLTRLCQLAQANIRSDIIGWQAGIAGGLIVFLGPLIVLWYGGVEVTRGALTVGSLIAFYSYLGKLYTPTSTLVQMVLSLQSTMTGIDRAFALLDAPVDIKENPNAQVLPNVQGRVEFENVSFYHQDSDFALKDLSFVAEPGTCIAVSILRPNGRLDHPRWLRPPRPEARLSPAANWHRLPRHLFVQRLLKRQHRLRPGRRLRSRDHRGSQAGRDPRFYPQPAARLRHGSRRARRQTLRRPEAAYRHRPRHPAQPQNPRAR
jgi:subfamily B ATP-binding cassette protein MsbA